MLCIPKIYVYQILLLDMMHNIYIYIHIYYIHKVDFKTHDEGKITIGCKACHQFQNNFSCSSACRNFANYLTPIPSDLKPARFITHQRTHIHQRAARCLLQAHGAAAPGTQVSLCAPSTQVSLCAPDVGAPLKNKFSNAWDGCCNGLAVSSPGMQEIGSRFKVAKYQWCIYEALRESHFHFLQTAHVVWLAQDERQGRLLVRFRAAKFTNRRIEVRHGIIGQTKGFGTGAENIKKATRLVIERFVTRGRCFVRGCCVVRSIVMVPLHASSA